MKARTTVAVVGGGISGLATAWWLKQEGVDVLVLEREAMPGGTIRTLQKDGYLIEAGPNSALDTTPLLRTLFEDLGLAADVVYANSLADKRYILKGGVLHPLPMSPGAFLQSRLWSTQGKLRLFGEPFIGRSRREETVAEFVQRRLGREFLDYAINPFVAGVYAGDPETLSVRAAFPKLYRLEEKYGGLIKGQLLGMRERKKRREIAKDRARMFSFRKGMQQLPAALGAALGNRFLAQTRVLRISEARGLFVIDGERRGEDFSIETDAVVSAIPAGAASPLVGPLDVAASRALKEIAYPPVAEVFLGFSSPSLRAPLDGFGFLVPARERRQILGTIYSSALFPGRAPEGYCALTTFVGGSRQPSLVEMDDSRLITMVTGELTAIMGLRGEPAFAYVSRWKEAIPQYTIGHLDRIEALQRLEAGHPGIFLTGNYRGGISLSDCIASSRNVADHVRTYLMNHRRAA